VLSFDACLPTALLNLLSLVGQSGDQLSVPVRMFRMIFFVGGFILDRPGFCWGHYVPPG